MAILTFGLAQRPETEIWLTAIDAVWIFSGTAAVLYVLFDWLRKK